MSSGNDADEPEPTASELVAALALDVAVATLRDLLRASENDPYIHSAMHMARYSRRPSEAFAVALLALSADRNRLREEFVRCLSSAPTAVYVRPDGSRAIAELVGMNADKDADKDADKEYPHGALVVFTALAGAALHGRAGTCRGCLRGNDGKLRVLVNGAGFDQGWYPVEWLRVQ